MKYIIPLVFIFALLAACAGPYPQRTGKPVTQLAWTQTLNPETGNPTKFWIPEFDKEENVEPLQARKEELRCVYKLYEGKNISELQHPNMIHKTLPKRKHQRWAYLISYVEQTTKSGGNSKSDEIIRTKKSTIFNFYTDLDGNIISCTWIKGTPAYLAEKRAKGENETDPGQ